MWQVQSREAASGRGRIYQILQGDVPLSFAQVFDKWAHDKAFIRFYTQILVEVDLVAYFWEHPPLQSIDLEQPYEFILIEAARLARVKPEPETFAAYYTDQDTVVAFPNLGKNAQLIVPCPQAKQGSFTSLAAFVRQADKPQIERFWQVLSHALGERLNQSTCWLSTAGMGVYWLHVRLDNRPKYYRHSAYKNPDFWS